MYESLLARVRFWTILLALPAAGVCWLLASGTFALGVLVTALWAVAGFYVLERLLRVAVVSPETPRNGFVIFLWLMVKLAVYGLAIWVLFSRPFPGMSHVVGLTLMMVVLVAVGAQARTKQIQDLQQSPEAPISGSERNTTPTSQSERDEDV